MSEASGLGEEAAASKTGSPHPPKSPVLVERPRIRFFWFALPAAVALAFLAMAVLAATIDEAAAPPVVVGVLVASGLTLLGFALLYLRVSLTADEHGVRITQVLGARTVPWQDVEDVVLVPVQAPVTVGFHQLALVTRDQEQLITSATGLVKPGCRLERLQQDLLAMRDRYAGPPDLPSAGDPAAVTSPADPNFRTGQAVLVQPRTGDPTHPHTMDTTTVARDERLVLAGLVVLAVGGTLWAVLVGNTVWTAIGGVSTLFFGWQALGARRVRLKADQDGLWIRNESRKTHLIPWPDLDSIEVTPMWTENGRTDWHLEFVTRDHRRIPDHTSLYDCPPEELYGLAQTLLAMRDDYAASA